MHEIVKCAIHENKLYDIYTRHLSVAFAILIRLFLSAHLCFSCITKVNVPFIALQVFQVFDHDIKV